MQAYPPVHGKRKVKRDLLAELPQSFHEMPASGEL
jgi:hypothetical protein